MPIRGEEKIEVQGVKFTVRHLPATTGFRVKARLLKMVAKIIKAGGNEVRDQIIDFADDFMGQDLTISEGDLSFLSATTIARLKKNSKLFTTVFKNADELNQFLDKHLTEGEVKNKTKIIAASKDSNGEKHNLTSSILTAIDMISGILDVIDEEELSDLMLIMVSKSILDYTYPDEKTVILSGGFLPTEEYDHIFAGDYEVLYELFVYLVLFNFEKSIKALKKSRIIEMAKKVIPMKKKEKKSQKKNEEGYKPEKQD